MSIDFKRGPVVLRSKDSTGLAFTVAKNPAATGDAVCLQAVASDDWNTPLSQWVVEPISDALFQIALFSSQGALYLQAAADAKGAAVQVGTKSTAVEQRWTFEWDDDDNMWLRCDVPDRHR